MQGSKAHEANLPALLSSVKHIPPFFALPSLVVNILLASPYELRFKLSRELVHHKRQPRGSTPAKPPLLQKNNKNGNQEYSAGIFSFIAASTHFSRASLPGSNLSTLFINFLSEDKLSRNDAVTRSPSSRLRTTYGVMVTINSVLSRLSLLAPNI